jgi:hypothetical protein
MRARQLARALEGQEDARGDDEGRRSLEPGAHLGVGSRRRVAPVRDALAARRHDLLRGDDEHGRRPALVPRGQGAVGGNYGSTLLEEIGAYSFGAAHPQGATTNAQALADDVPLEIDGACCYNALQRAP